MNNADFPLQETTVLHSKSPSLLSPPSSFSPLIIISSLPLSFTPSSYSSYMSFFPPLSSPSFLSTSFLSAVPFLRFSCLHSHKLPFSFNLSSLRSFLSIVLFLPFLHSNLDFPLFSFFHPPIYPLSLYLPFSPICCHLSSCSSVPSSILLYLLAS